MELQGSLTIPAAPQQVWQALNNPEILRLCIPGCEEVRQISPQEMHARVLLKLGPVRANFVGKVLLTDVRPLLGCTLNFEGSGGSAGFARGSSVITLTAIAEDTRLDYTTQASVAGKLGQIGGRLMDASARQLADRFFAAFKAQIAGAATGERQIAVAQAAGAEATTAAPVNFPVVARAASATQSPQEESWFDKEKPRLLWFMAGVAATSTGVWMGAHWLR